MSWVFLQGGSEPLLVKATDKLQVLVIVRVEYFPLNLKDATKQ